MMIRFILKLKEFLKYLRISHIKILVSVYWLVQPYSIYFQDVELPFQFKFSNKNNIA